MSSEVNPYQVSREKEAELTCELLEERPPRSLVRHACYEISGTDRYSDIGRSVEADVFGNFFHDTPEDMQEGYSPYEEQSTFFVNVDVKKKMATGVLRLIEYGENGLKTLNDLSHIVSEENVLNYHGVDKITDCVDVSTLGIRKEHRGRISGAGVLYRGALLYSRDNNLKHYITALDERAYSRITEYTGAPFEPLVGLKPIPYMGSKKTQPAYMDLSLTVRENLKHLATPKGIIGARMIIPHALGTHDRNIIRK